MITIYGMNAEQQRIVIAWCNRFNLELPPESDDPMNFNRLAKARYHFQSAGGSVEHAEADALFLKPR